LAFSSAHAPDGCGFISYDDEQSIAAKASYVKSNGLGGVIEWEINEAYQASAATAKNPLLTAIASSILH
jgi:chitinase